MKEIFDTLRNIAIVIVCSVFALFLVYFIVANDHLTTIYLSPILLKQNAPSAYQAPLWVFVLGGFFLGVLLMAMIARSYLLKSEENYKKLAKENSDLKGKFEKVKVNISKCVD